ncbi:esterase/lipase family protein [Mariniblastus fucicola]|uniref:Alpha/beta hydrolase family protein n=1 Tax=Mariniblastus fucicola TaxID=980251 RepID=A0A5B9PDF3_9BACT|nr:alpha/beta hydrolase [Mariniblastus fucicola]QEG23489.1 Alpha/beta hydrolase family protein [Mariniblastus fucicola]
MCAVTFMGCLMLAGCQLNQENVIRRVAAISRLGNGPIVEVTPIKRTSPLTQIRSYVSGPQKPGERTIRLLRTYNLEQRLYSDPDQVIEWLGELVKDSPTLEEVHALAEICKLRADWLIATGDPSNATGLYAYAIVHAHQFLFDTNPNLKRNAYDPQFRSICDVYNESLAGILRISSSESTLLPGHRFRIGDDQLACEIEFQVEGRWKDQHFERFELVNDYETSGIDNQYRTYGLGVPLIAICKTEETGAREDRYYPPSLTLPLTAFCEITESGDPNVRKAVVKLYDPLETTFVNHRDVTVPLESDLTTPLAYHLNDPLLNSGLLATATLINGELADGIHGMYMMAPYDPTKIPVVMVHGIWSSPVTWAHMFNDLRAIPEIHENYQFWFYAYPTGQPFWISAQQMREDLVTIRRELDPGQDSPVLDDMILVGHSMGGLVSQLQVIDSGDQFWNELVSERPFEELGGDPETVQRLRDTFFFKANASVDRVVMIGTPNHGSSTANATTRWLGQKLFTLPAFLGTDFEKLVRENPDVLGDGELLTTNTSVDALAEDCPIFDVMNRGKRPADVKFHNIIGQVPKRGLLLASSQPGDGDGVVSVESAKSEFADSEVVVNSEHSKIHQHPSCILEVRKILTENLVEKNLIRSRKFPEIPAAWESPATESPD